VERGDRETFGPNSGAPGGCPSAEHLAAYADGQLSATESRNLDEHLVACELCREVLVEASAFLAAERPDRRGRVLGFRQRTLWSLGGIAAAAAIAMIALRIVGIPGTSEREAGDAELRRELVQAVAAGPTRPLEARLTGGFPYQPQPIFQRGPDRLPAAADVRIAAAHLDQMAQRLATPAASAAAGVGALATGDLDRAINLLEASAAAAPRSAAYESDLSAAYLARARARGQKDDWSRALAAADRAIALDGRLTEGLFNRALALDGLERTGDAQRAWSVYLERDSSSNWAREAGIRRAGGV